MGAWWANGAGVVSHGREVHPGGGAQPGVTVSRFLHGAQMISAELGRLTRGFQTRPGATAAALEAAWAEARAEYYVLAGSALPADYLEFLAASNGAYGQTGEHGLWLRLEAIEDVLPLTRAHGLPPGLLLIGSTRLGDGLAIDTRARPAQIVTLALGWWGEHDVLDVLGPSLEAALAALATMGPPATPWATPVAGRLRQKLDIGYVATPQPVVEAMLRAAAVKPGETVYDLGCGDGRIVITAARSFGARAVGFDLNVELIQSARALAVTANVRHMATFRLADMFTVDLSPADVVALFLRPETNQRLLPQLRQLKPGARVVTYEFKIPGYEPAHTELVEYVPGVKGKVLVWPAPFE